jgi:hypothetical protein
MLLCWLDQETTGSSVQGNHPLHQVPATAVGAPVSLRACRRGKEWPDRRNPATPLSDAPWVAAWRPGAWGARSRVSCCVLILMDQSTEDVAAAQPAEARRTPCLGSLLRHRRRVGQASVRAALVVMLDVASQDRNELVATDDEQLVQALPAYGTDPAFGDGIGVGRLHGRADHLGPGRPPRVVERPGELGVPVADQELERGGLLVGTATRLRACWATHHPVGYAVTPARCTRRLPSSMKNSTYTLRRKTVSTVKKAQARMAAACWRRNDRPLVEARRGAGSRPWARNTRLIELADTRTPRCNSSPWMRW